MRVRLLIDGSVQIPKHRFVSEFIVLSHLPNKAFTTGFVIISGR
jgi:hypothetical protein